MGTARTSHLVCLAAALALPLALPLTPDGQEAPADLLKVSASPQQLGLGALLVPAGDLDGDGHTDLLVGAAQIRPEANSGAGLLAALSCIDGRVLLQCEGRVPGEAFGSAAVRFGDWDGDGRDDFMVSAPRNDELAVNGGVLRMVSGATGKLLAPPPPPRRPGDPEFVPIPMELFGQEPFGRLGQSLALLDDLDGDGLAEVAAAAPSDASLSFEPGYVLVVSPTELSPILEIWGETRDEGFGAVLLAVPDLDDDGHLDLAVGAPGALVKDDRCGRVAIFSSRTGRQLHNFKGTPGSRFGSALALIADGGGSGKPALLVGAPGDGEHGHEAGSALLLSLPKGDVLQRWHGAAAFDLFGTAVASVGDVDGDGHADAAVSAPGADGGGHSAGQVSVLDVRNGRALLVVNGHVAGEHLGLSLAGVGDLNDDGHADLALGLGRGEGGAAGGIRIVPGRKAPEPEEASGKGKKKR